MQRMRTDAASLGARAERLRTDAATAHAAAQRAAAEGRRDMARVALERKVQLGGEAERLDAMRSTLEQQLRAAETAQMTRSVAESMRDGAALMAEAERALNTEQLHRDMVDTRMNARRIDEATRLMTRPLFDAPAANVDEGGGDLDDELDALMASVALDASTETRERSAEPVTPQPTPARKSRAAAQNEMGL